MLPNFTVGVFNEVVFRGANSTVDGCGPESDLMCVHSIAPWEIIWNEAEYRVAGGAPVDGGITIDHSAAAINKLYPNIAKDMIVCKNVSWDIVQTALLSGRPVSLSVLAGSLPWHGTYTKNHRIAIYMPNQTDVRAMDPLKAAYSIWIKTTLAAVQKAATDYPEPGINAIIFPTADVAFRSGHPLYKTAFNDGVSAASTAAKSAYKS